MILQALRDYYVRKMADPNPRNRLPPFGFDYVKIPFVLEISRNGNLLGVVDTRSGEGKAKQAETYLAPKGVKRRGKRVMANLLWDKAPYAIGMVAAVPDNADNPEETAKKREAAKKDAAKKNEEFRKRIEILPTTALADEGVQAILNFLSSDPLQQVQSDSLYREMGVSDNLSFRLSGDNTPVFLRPTVTTALPSVLSATSQEEVADGICLVSGRKSSIALCHPAIMGVKGCKAAGGDLVSFNFSAAESWGKRGKKNGQGRNSPVGELSAFEYTTALNHMLGYNSRQHLPIRETTTVFWAQTPDDFEDNFATFFGGADNPDDVESLRAALNAIRSGKYAGGLGDNQFFVLVLAPSAARISVRVWKVKTLREVAEHVVTWFDDIDIVRPKDAPEHPSLFRLLADCAVQRKVDNVPPNLGGDIMRAILSGSAYPVSWFNAAVQRSRAEQEVTHLRAAAIKACLNRNNNLGLTQEFTTMLDPDNINVAYRLGRLFAVLEQLQKEASPGISATIRDRFYGAASSTPVAVFTTLLRLKNYHITKLENKGRAVNFEKWIGEIMDCVPDFPRHLSLPDQGRFALGYYHQRQHFFAKTTTHSTGEPENAS